MTPSRRQLEAYRLKHAAEEGRVIIYRCGRCKRETALLAVDMIEIWNPEMKVYEPPARCGFCKASGRMTVRFYIPTRGDIGTLRLRRPNGVRRLWKWQMYEG
ncbi:hypothetical protein JHL21_03360 [Devosia sp. WQ 349]|uniref:hypothetical protein n=1 Tax=Devosia sp. WQ 349K1 TaxID=2800329 RepID=UPI0019087DED|nr:hypothetical protein [Devosia sp. WQ 349K1]MBK1793529.1 hypothetical protein [Devosia sp. WQ 349K1]